jgi:hypothetical protein
MVADERFATNPLIDEGLLFPVDSSSEPRLIGVGLHRASPAE